MVSTRGARLSYPDTLVRPLFGYMQNGIRAAPAPVKCSHQSADPDCAHHIMLCLSGLDAIGYALLQRNIPQTYQAKPVSVKSASNFPHPGFKPSPVYTIRSESSISIDAPKQKVEGILLDLEPYKEWYVGPYSSWYL